MTERVPDEVVAPAGPPNSRRAVAVGVLGIGSLPGLLFCGLGGILAVVALVLTPGARREVEASPGTLGGLNLIRVARLCSVIALVIVAVVLLVAVVALIVLTGLGPSEQ